MPKMRTYRIWPGPKSSAFDSVEIKASYFEVDAFGANFFTDPDANTDPVLVGHFAHPCNVVEQPEAAA